MNTHSSTSLMCCCLTFCSPLFGPRGTGGKRSERREAVAKNRNHTVQGEEGQSMHTMTLKKQLTAALLWCAGPAGRPLASSPRAAALTFPRHLGRPLRAANADPRGLCFSMQPEFQALSAAALTVVSTLLSLCPTCNFLLQMLWILSWCVRVSASLPAVT